MIPEFSKDTSIAITKGVTAGYVFFLNENVNCGMGVTQGHEARDG